MTGLDAQQEALDVEAHSGEVVITGPRVAVALTPAAAAETARLLAQAADFATRNPDGPAHASQT